MTSLHLHAPHVPYSYSLLGIIVGVTLLPMGILGLMFFVYKAIAGLP